jgi:hypothetical protein
MIRFHLGLGSRMTASVMLDAPLLIELRNLGHIR